MAKKGQLKLVRDEASPGRPLTDRELLALPDRGPPRESLGDRYFWPLTALVGLGILLIPWVLRLPIAYGTVGWFIIASSLWRWMRDGRSG